LPCALWAVLVPDIGLALRPFGDWCHSYLTHLRPLGVMVPMK